MTETKTWGNRGLLAAAAILLLAHAMAGAVNAIGFIMGNPPTPLGILATLVVVCAWPIAGWIAGSRSGGGFLRLATVFWVFVVAGIPLVRWVLVDLPGRSVSQGGLVPFLLWFALLAPLYGLVAMLPYQAAPLWAACMGVAVLAATLAAYFAGRRIRKRSAQAGVEQRESNGTADVSAHDRPART